MGIRKWANSKPKKVSKGKGTGAKLLNGISYAGTKVGQWTAKPGIKAYDIAKGKKRKKK